MARPKSEEKRQALLNAATEIVAEHGLAAAPTAKIAKLAGVAEGTLFCYFVTKDELLNELYIHIKQSMCQALAEKYDTSASFKLKFQYLWNSYIDWGLANPRAYKVINQLAVSSLLTEATLKRAEALFPDLDVTSKFSDNDVFKRREDYANAIFDAIANTTIAFVTNEPHQAKTFKDRGFMALWKIYGDG
ncbi:MAG: TetR/AcrR family transcriptional regulator [Alphaproteobacteria bacterium]